MFAILAVNILGNQLGYCGGMPSDKSIYGIGVTQVELCCNFSNITSVQNSDMLGQYPA